MPWHNATLFLTHVTIQCWCFWRAIFHTVIQRWGPCILQFLHLLEPQYLLHPTNQQVNRECGKSRASNWQSRTYLSSPAFYWWGLVMWCFKMQGNLGNVVPAWATWFCGRRKHKCWWKVSSSCHTWARYFNTPYLSSVPSSIIQRQ